MKIISKTALPFLLGTLFVLCHADAARADVITSATLNFNLDGNAFANGADVPYIATFDVEYNTNQTFMEFAGHNASTLPGRPLPSPANFDTVRDGWVRPDSSSLGYNFDPNGSLQTFAFDPSNVATAGGTGSTRFLGGTSFWYANDSLIYQGDFSSIWLEYGNLSLSYDATRAAGGNSGWFITNNYFVPLSVFDLRNVSLTSVAATETVPGSLVISGDLFTSQEFRDAFAIQAGLDVGSFMFSAQTVPEPSSALLLGLASACLALIHRRRRVHSEIAGADKP